MLFSHHYGIRSSQQKAPMSYVKKTSNQRPMGAMQHNSHVASKSSSPPYHQHLPSLPKLQTSANSGDGANDAVNDSSRLGKPS